MAEGRDEGSIAPRRSLGGPILPPPPPEIEESSRKAEQQRARQEQASRERAEREQAAQDKAAQDKASQKRAAEEKAAAKRAKAEQRAPRESAQGGAQPASAQPASANPASANSASANPSLAANARSKASSKRAPAQAGSSRRAQLRLVQVDAWSVMKTSFLLSIALGIVLIVAVAIIWAVLGAAGVWDSINSIVQQAVGGETGKPFDITDYAGTSRVLGFTMVVAVIDVILITAIATLGAFLYNLSAALLGGIEVTLAEDS